MTTTDDVAREASDPATTPERLAALLSARPDLAATIAQHPQAYPELLAWIAQHADPAAQAVARRRIEHPRSESTPLEPAVTIPFELAAAAPVAGGDQGTAVTEVSDPVSPEGSDPVSPEVSDPVSTDVPGTRTSKSRSYAFMGIAAVAAVAIVAALLFAFWPKSGHADAKPDPAKAQPTDCAGYLKLTSAERLRKFSGKAVMAYGAAGAVKTPVTTLYDAACPAHKGEDYSLSSVETDVSVPQCSDFTTLDPEAQSAWVQAMASDSRMDPWRDEWDAAFLAQACADFHMPEMVLLVGKLEDYRTYGVWDTETKLGFSWRSVIGIGAVEAGADAKPIPGGNVWNDGLPTAAPDYTPGTACGFDPKTDAIIPVSISLNNTTQSSQTPFSMRIQWTLRVVRGTSPTTTAYLETNYSSGPTCSKAADSYNGATLDSKWEPTNSVYSTHSVVILKNWISPRNPNGATADLSAYEFVAQSLTANPNDPVVTQSSTAFLLDGTKER